MRNSIILGFLVCVLMCYSCRPKYFNKTVNSQIYRFKASTIKSNNCIKVELPWLDDIIRNKGIYIEVDDKISDNKFDTRYLGKQSYYFFERNKGDFNTSICFETQEQFMNVFGKREKFDLLDAPFLPNGKAYILKFYKLSEPLNEKYLWTGRAMFNSKGERESILFFRTIIK